MAASASGQIEYVDIEWWLRIMLEVCSVEYSSQEVFHVNKKSVLRFSVVKYQYF